MHPLSLWSLHYPSSNQALLKLSLFSSHGSICGSREMILYFAVKLCIERMFILCIVLIYLSWKKLNKSIKASNVLWELMWCYSFTWVSFRDPKTMQWCKIITGDVTDITCACLWIYCGSAPPAASLRVLHPTAASVHGPENGFSNGFWSSEPSWFFHPDNTSRYPSVLFDYNFAAKSRRAAGFFSWVFLHLLLERFPLSSF